MRYPRAIENRIETIRAVVSLWPQDLDVGLEQVIDWVLQFDEPDFELALRVIQNLSVVGQREIDRGLKVAFSKLVRKAHEKGSRTTGRNTLYAAMGDVGKSGAMVSYHFRMNNSVSEENFLNADTLKYIEQGFVENIVLIDDVIGTGGQATKEIDALAANVLPLGVKNIFVLTVSGMRDAIDEIQDKTKAFTFSAFEYSTPDTAASLDSEFYSGLAYDDRVRLKNRLEDYGEVCYPRNALGYGGLAGLLVFPYNTPNSTLPIVWSDNNGWIPLFRRVRRVNGIAAYQSQFKRAAEKKAKTETKEKAHVEIRSVSLFVEGKRDELFFDEFARHVKLGQALGMEEVSVVSLGTNVASEKLAELLAKTNPDSIFIVDDDHSYVARIHEKLESVASVVKLRPSFFYLVDVDKAAAILLPPPLI